MLYILCIVILYPSWLGTFFMFFMICTSWHFSQRVDQKFCFYYQTSLPKTLFRYFIHLHTYIHLDLGFYHVYGSHFSQNVRNQYVHYLLTKSKEAHRCHLFCQKFNCLQRWPRNYAANHKICHLDQSESLLQLTIRTCFVWSLPGNMALSSIRRHAKAICSVQTSGLVLEFPLL